MKIKNLMYLHGLMGHPTPEKMNLLAPKTNTLYYPTLDYFNHPNLFGWLLEEVKKREIDYIVGSSAGGLMGYWLAKHTGCNALLFNPALAKFELRRDIAKYKTNLDDLPAKSYFLDIVIGEKDDTIIPQTTLDFLEKNENPQNYRLHFRTDLGHRIDIDTFAWATSLLPE